MAVHRISEIRCAEIADVSLYMAFGPTETYANYWNLSSI